MTARPNPAQRERLRRRALYQRPAACPLTVVCGPPAAGKSTHVARNAGPADAVIDLDALARALSAPDTEHHHYPDHIRTAAIAARRAAIDRLLGLPACPHLWLIHAHPDLATVRTYQRLAAEFVVVDPGERIVRSRVKFQRPRGTMAEVDRWYRSPPLIPNPLRVAEIDVADF